MILPETRIFGIGLSKTGTTSLHKALIMLDQVSLHWPRPYFDYQANTKKIANERGDNKSLIGRFGSSGWMPEYWNALSNCNEHEYPECDNRYPGSKFILTTRKPDSWHKSLSRWFPHDRPGGPRRSDSLAAYMDKQRLRVWGRTTYDRLEMRRMYEEHESGVLNYFKDRPDDLLVLPLETPDPEKWEMLCTFLELEQRRIHVKTKPILYPRVNIQDYDGTRGARRIMRNNASAKAKGPEALKRLEEKRTERRKKQDEIDKKRGPDFVDRRAKRRKLIQDRLIELQDE